MDVEVNPNDIESVRSESLEIGDKSDQEEAMNGEEHLVLRSQGTN